MVQVVHGIIPAAHSDRICSDAHIDDITDEGLRAAASQAHREYFQYLSDLLLDNPASYASQVSSLLWVDA